MVMKSVEWLQPSKDKHSEKVGGCRNDLDGTIRNPECESPWAVNGAVLPWIGSFWRSLRRLISQSCLETI